MRTIILTLVVFFLSLSMLFAQDDIEPFGFEGRPLVENIWSHSAHTLNKGEFMIGIGPIRVWMPQSTGAEKSSGLNWGWVPLILNRVHLWYYRLLVCGGGLMLNLESNQSNDLFHHG